MEALCFMEGTKVEAELRLKGLKGLKRGEGT
jgi:hypothetical protein